MEHVGDQATAPFGQVGVHSEREKERVVEVNRDTLKMPKMTMTIYLPSQTCYVTTQFLLNDTPYHLLQVVWKKTTR